MGDFEKDVLRLGGIRGEPHSSRQAEDARMPHQRPETHTELLSEDSNLKMTRKKFQGLRIGHKRVIQFWGVLVAKCISKANIRFRYGAVLWFTTARQL